MAVSSFKISDDLNLDGVKFNITGATTGQVLTYASSTTSFVPTTETPAGTIVMYAGSSVPSGWLLCNGASFLSGTYPNLATAVGDIYTTHSGTTYYLPNLVSKIPIGMSSGTTPSLTTSTSSTNTFNHSHTADYGTSGAAVQQSHSHTSNGDGGHSHSVTSDDKGNHAHGGTLASAGAHSHTHNTKLANPANALTSFSDSSHTHGTTASNANHSHTDAASSANHTHTATGNADISHTHAITSITSSSQNTSISNHSHGTFAVMQVMFIIKT